MPSDPGAGRRRQRLHPSSLLFSIGASVWSLLIPGLLFLVFARGKREDIFLMFLFAPALLRAVLRYVSLRYELDREELVIHEGLVAQNTRHIPYARIHNIDLVQNPAHRFLQVAEVRIETASGAEPEAVLRVLPMAAVEELRRRVSAFAVPHEDEPESARSGHALSPDVPDPDTPIFTMRLREVIAFGLISNRGLTLIFAALYLAAEFDLLESLGRSMPDYFPELTALASSSNFLLLPLLGLVCLMVLSMAWAILKVHGFTLRRHGDSLRIVCGLITRHTATIPRYRIQYLSLRENPVHRWLDRVSVRVETAGGNSQGERTVSREWLVPMAPKNKLESILAHVQPEVRFAVDWLPVDPRARGRLFRKGLLVMTALVLASLPALGPWALAVWPVLAGLAFGNATLQARALGYAVTPEAILLRRGWWTREQRAVRFSKVQSILLARSPFDRRLFMASLSIDTAGSGQPSGRFRIPYLTVPTAMRLMRRLRREAEASEFRW